MNYNESDYQKYYQECVDLLGEIRLKELNFEHKPENTNLGIGILVDEINDSFINSIIAPKQVFEKVNNVMSSIKLTQEMLAASYSLLKLQLEEVELLKEKDEDPNYFWFIFYFEDSVNRIFTLDDLLWSFVNYYCDYNEKDSFSLKRTINKRLNNNKEENKLLKEILNMNDFKTKAIRNSSIHNSKPFFYTGQITVKDGLIGVGKGNREFELEDDMPKLEHDIKYISSKYKMFIEVLNLEVVESLSQDKNNIE